MLKFSSKLLLFTRWSFGPTSEMPDGINRSQLPHSGDELRDTLSFCLSNQIKKKITIRKGKSVCKEKKCTDKQQQVLFRSKKKLKAWILLKTAYAIVSYTCFPLSSFSKSCPFDDKYQLDTRVIPVLFYAFVSSLKRVLWPQTKAHTTNFQRERTQTQQRQNDTSSNTRYYVPVH